MDWGNSFSRFVCLFTECCRIQLSFPLETTEFFFVLNPGSTPRTLLGLNSCWFRSPPSLSRAQAHSSHESTKPRDFSNPECTAPAKQNMSAKSPVAASPQKGKTAKSVEYPPFTEFLQRFILTFTRGPLYAALFTCYLIRPYFMPALISWWKTVDLAALPIPQMIHDLFLPGGFAENTNLRESLFFVGLFMTIHEILYFGLNSLSLLCDTFGWLHQYKLPRTQRMLPSRALITRTIIEGIINHFIFQPLSLFLVFVKVSKFPRLFEATPGTMDSMPLLETALHFAACLFCNEVGFYFAHRLVHHPSLYHWIHKKHHQFVGTIGFAAEYAHPIEQIVANQIPTISYVLLFRSEVVGFEIAMVWLAWRVWETYEAHSGYAFEGTLPHKLGFLHVDHTRHHDWHHTDNRGNFGSFWIDYPFGTMDSYAEKLANEKKLLAAKKTA